VTTADPARNREDNGQDGLVIPNGRSEKCFAGGGISGHAVRCYNGSWSVKRRKFAIFWTEQLSNSMDFREDLIALLPRLRRFAAGLCGDLSTADDLVQEACGRAIANQTKWRPGTRLDSWMYRIIQNLYRDQLRATSVSQRYTAENGPLMEQSVDGALAIETRANLGIVQAGIQGLPEDQRIVLLMVCVEGLSYRETAEALEVPVGTVMSRLARARRRLHVLLDGTEPILVIPAENSAR
jgi:RNA polymerase sigma-70 factor (ECF subfamily)